MCGRFSLNTQLEELSRRLEPWLTRIDDPWLEHYAPRAQIRPGEPVLVLYREHGQERLGHMLWGLLPSWVKDPSQGPRPFNARAETLSDKASFRGPWRHHRCLLPASAFLEKGERVERNDGCPFWLAGLWDRWMGPDGSELDSCCVITTQPNQLLKSLHDRMPVVIPDGLEGVWLEAGDHNHRKALEPMLTPWDGTNWKRDGERQLPLF